MLFVVTTSAAKILRIFGIKRGPWAPTCTDDSMSEQKQFGNRISPLGQNRQLFVLADVFPRVRFGTMSRAFPDQRIGCLLNDVSFGFAVIFDGSTATKVLVASHVSELGSNQFLALVVVLDHRGTDEKRTNAFAMFAGDIDDRFDSTDSVVEPNRPMESNLAAGVIHWKVG